MNSVDAKEMWSYAKENGFASRSGTTLVNSGITVTVYVSCMLSMERQADIEM